MPPGIEPCWDDNPNWFKAQLIAYNQIRQYEEAEWDVSLAGATMANRIV
jgi:hypothetical protein